MTAPAFTIAGEITLPLSENPHWLIAGQAGSGKSNFVNGLLVSMMEKHTPDQLNICWIDPRKTEADLYKGTPFCPIDPVVDMGDAYGLMEYLVWEMNRRYDMLESANISSIDKFNTWVEENPEKGLNPLPYIVVVIDDYADMVAQSPQVEKPIRELTTRSRAVGIHLIVVTQRPSATIISEDIKANLPARICFQVGGAISSYIAIGQPGGEKLQDCGDMLFKDTSGQVTRLQAGFIPHEKVQEVCEKSRELYGSPAPIDYRKIAVDNGSCQWVSGGGEPHVKPND